MKAPKKHSGSWRAGVLALAAAGLVLGSRAPARADIIERVVAVVNDQAIFLSDLRRRAVPFIPQIARAGNESERLSRLQQLYRKLLDELIDEDLYEQAAKRMGVHVTDDDIDEAVKNVEKNVGLDGDAFWNAVREQGMTESEYRQNLHRQLVRVKVLNEKARNRVSITEKDVRRQYDDELRKANRKLRFRAAHCFFPVADGANATEVAAIREQAAKARQGLTAKTFQQCIDAHEGGELGWLSQGDLPSSLEHVLLALEPGQISAAVRGPSGYHIFLLHEREQGGANIPPYEQVKGQIFRQMLDKAMAEQENQLLKELRRNAVIKKRL